MPMMRPRPTSPASRLIHASLEVKIDEPVKPSAIRKYQPGGEAIEFLHGEEGRDVEAIAGQQEIADAGPPHPVGCEQGTEQDADEGDAGAQSVESRVGSALFQQEGQQWRALADAEAEDGDRGDRRDQSPAPLMRRVWRRPCIRAWHDPFQGKQQHMEWHRRPLYGRGDRAPFALIVAITACGTLGMHLIIPALPDTAAALRVSPAAIQLSITLYLVGLAIGQLVYGPISDRFGRRPVLLVGLGLFTVAGLATTVAPNAWMLVVARILQSIGACAGLVLGRAIVRDSATPDRAAAQLAMLTLVMSAAPAIAPVLGGYATAWFGWRAAFALLAIVGGVTLVLAVLLLPETGAVQSSSRASMLLGSLRLLRSRAFRGYIVGGACHHHVVLCVHGGFAVHPG